MEQVGKLAETWAKKKDAHAQYLLGLRYANGWDRKADIDEAVRWFMKAARANHGGALCQLGLLNEFNPSAMGQDSYDKALITATDYYRKASAAGDVEATANYGAMLSDGRGTAQDLALAETTYLKCLQLSPNHARAHCNLAVLYEMKLRNGIKTLPDDEIERIRALMVKHYEESVRNKNSYAARNIGGLYHEGLLVKQDYRKAYRYFDQAVEWGLPAVHAQLGEMHELGQGIPVTYTEAAYHYRLAALEGDKESLRRLINFYLTGTGVSLDLERASFWLQYMMRLGEYRVLPKICDILLKKGDYAAVVPLLKQLCDFDNDVLAGYAYYQLAICYEQGLGVKPNAGRAKKHFDKAIELGDGSALTGLALQLMQQGKKQESIATLLRAAPKSRDACYYLGQMYYFGTNVEKDKAKSLQFMRSAADLNHAEALFFLAALTYNKESGAPSLEQAIKFAQQAENTGLTKAGQLREKLERRRKETEAVPEETTPTRSS